MWAFSNSLLVKEARELYFSKANFSSDVYKNRYSEYKIGPLKIKLPNTGQIPFHDIHHILTEYDTTYLGEFQVAAWEVGSGGSPKIGPWLYMLSGLFWGTILSPLKTFRAFVRGRRSRNLLKQTPSDFHSLDQKTVGDLRKELGVPPCKFKPDIKISDTMLFGVYFGALLLFFILIWALPVYFVVKVVK